LQILQLVAKALVQIHTTFQQENMVNEKENSIKVLRIINRFNLGGPIFNVTMLTKYLPPVYQTTLVGGSPLAQEQSAIYILDEYLINGIVIPEMTRKISFIGDLVALYKLIKIIKIEQPTIVHTHASKAGSLGRIAAKLMGVKIIVHTFHGNVFSGYFNGFISNLLVKFERHLAKSSSAIIAISEQQKKELVNTYRIAKSEKIHIIPLGFDLTKFLQNDTYRISTRKRLAIENEIIAVSLVGRITAIKNHALFIEAAAITLKQHPDKFKFYIVGDGELKQDLVHYIKTQFPSIIPHIIFTSWIKDMEQFYSAMDIVCLTSKNEGTPVTLIEAQAAGKPVISTNVGGVVDVVKNLETGFIMEGFDPNELSKHMINLYLNEHLRTKMSQNARNFVKDQFSYRRLVNDMDKLYKSLLSNA